MKQSASRNCPIKNYTQTSRNIWRPLKNPADKSVIPALVEDRENIIRYKTLTVYENPITVVT